MSWMILLMPEKKLVGEKWGDGCRNCRFLRFRNADNPPGIRGECICDERVNVYRDGQLSDHRPYECPFRYYTDVSPITDRFDGMTKEETKGWFEGAAAEHENYKRLEMERDEYVGSEAYRRLHDDER